MMNAAELALLYVNNHRETGMLGSDGIKNAVLENPKLADATYLELIERGYTEEANDFALFMFLLLEKQSKYLAEYKEIARDNDLE
jgi:hypothetical protein